MSASVLNPNQLKLFMSGTEFKNASSTSVDLSYRDRTMDQLWTRKLAEAKAPAYTGHGAGIYESLKNEGFNKEHYGGDWDTPTLMFAGHRTDPVPVMKQGEGHHRVAAAAEIERESGGRRTIWMPVRYENHSQWAPTVPPAVG